MSIRQIVSVALLVCVACGGSSAAFGDEPAQNAPVAAAASTAAGQDAPAEKAPAEEAPAKPKAAVTGTVKFEGEIPAPERVDLSPDPVCKEHHGDAGMSSPSTVKRGEGGGLADVFVQLTTGVPDEKYEAPKEPVVLDQQGCTYVPHVFGLMKKQTIKILNSDATLHNIHAMPRSNKEFNLAMPNKGDVREQEFKKAEEALKIKCDVHPWMLAYAFVMEHPYFGVTDAKGKFSIPSDLADGEYGIKLWHETLGEATGTLTVKDGAGTFEHTYKK
jgi:hypothetical protein